MADKFVPTDRLLYHWAEGPGGKDTIKWGTGGDMDRCTAHLGKHVKDPKVLSGLCSTLKHRAATHKDDDKDK